MGEADKVRSTRLVSRTRAFLPGLPDKHAGAARVLCSRARRLFGDHRRHACRTAMFNPYPLILILAMALAGCAALDRAPAATPPAPIPPVQISAMTWWQVDGEIKAASLAAAKVAEDYARGPMERWRRLVGERTEADYIPWFTGYWTQKWLAIKVAWYKLSAGEEKDLAVRRLTAYLQEQYYERVLNPVAKEIDPDVVRAQATERYVRLLGERLEPVAGRYRVPPDQFDRRLKDIPAIALAPPPAHSASLYHVVHADPIAALPANAALIARMREGAGPADSRISPLARRASERLAAKLAKSGGAGAAAAALGGVAGMVISLAAASVDAIAHENQRSEMEVRLRESLNAAADDMWFSLMNDPDTGVMAGAHHISEQIEGSLTETLTQPVTTDPLPQEAPLPGEAYLQNQRNDGEAPARDGDAVR